MDQGGVGDHPILCVLSIKLQSLAFVALESEVPDRLTNAIYTHNTTS